MPGAGGGDQAGHACHAHIWHSVQTARFLGINKLERLNREETAFVLYDQSYTSNGLSMI